MNLHFDLNKVEIVEFGIDRDDGTKQRFVAVPVDTNVQTALREMAQATWRVMQQDEDVPKKYEHSEKDASVERLYSPVNDGMTTDLLNLHQAVNLPIDVAALNSPTGVFRYFVRLTDNRQRKLTALRRATQFNGIVKNKGRLVRLIDDTL